MSLAQGNNTPTKLCVMYIFEIALVMNENVSFRFLCTGYFKQVYLYNKLRNALPTTKQKIKNKLFRNVTNIHMDSDFVVNKVSFSIYKKILPKVELFLLFTLTRGISCRNYNNNTLMLFT